VIDLHTHSTHSDGTKTPTEVAELARVAGLTAIALTDHDTTSSADEMAEACAQRGLDYIPGIELSLVDPLYETTRGGVVGPVHAHVLVYWPPLDLDHPFQQRLEDVRRGRVERNHTLLARLRDAGFTSFTYADLVRVAGGEENIGKPHFAELMVTHHPELVRGATTGDYQPVYDHFIGDQGQYYVERESPTLDEILTLLRDYPTEGGRSLVVIAHPLRNYFGDASTERMERELGSLFRSFRDRGVDGVEAYYGGWPEETRRFVLDTAKGAGLLVTGGSDFHGEAKPHVVIAQGAHGVHVPDDVLTALRAAR
jgi:hypothetical protein